MTSDKTLVCEDKSCFYQTFFLRDSNVRNHFTDRNLRISLSKTVNTENKNNDRVKYTNKWSLSETSKAKHTVIKFANLSVWQRADGLGELIENWWSHACTSDILFVIVQHAPDGILSNCAVCVIGFD